MKYLSNTIEADTEVTCSGVGFGWDFTYAVQLERGELLIPLRLVSPKPLETGEAVRDRLKETSLGFLIGLGFSVVSHWELDA